MEQILFLAAAAQDVGIGESLANAARDTGEAFGFNWSLFFSQVISFCIVCFLLHRFAYKPILNVLEERRQTIADAQENARKVKQELAEAESTRRELIEKANAEAAKLIEEAREAASRVRDTECQKAIKEAEQIIAKAREANQAERARMVSEVRGELGRLVTNTTAAVIGKVLTEDDQQRLVRETNQELAVG